VKQHKAAAGGSSSATVISSAQVVQEQAEEVSVAPAEDNSTSKSIAVTDEDGDAVGQDAQALSQSAFTAQEYQA